MVIVVEGIDRVGKTTLCEMIEQQFSDMQLLRFRDDTRYIHHHKDMYVNTEKINTLQNLMEAGFVDNIILDRYHITEFVYGSVERSYKNENMFDIDTRLAVMGTVILVYVVPTDIKASSSEHGKNLERHLKWYEDFYNNITQIKDKIKVDYETLGDALDFINEVLGLPSTIEPGGTGESSEVSNENGEVV